MCERGGVKEGGMQKTAIPERVAAESGGPTRTPVPMLDLKRQYKAIHGELLEALGQVLETQQFILGEHVAAFERAAAEQLGVKHALGCSSGTDALWLALAAAGVGPGDAVVTTPFSFFASVSAILRAGATPVLADIDPVTFNLSPAAVEKVLDGKRGAGVKAILPVHLYGLCANATAFSRFGRERGLTIDRRRGAGMGRGVEGSESGRAGRCGGVQLLSHEEPERGGRCGDGDDESR